MEGKLGKGWEVNPEREDGVLWRSIAHGPHSGPFAIVVAAVDDCCCRRRLALSDH
jgi:hypothetical protein